MQDIFHPFRLKIDTLFQRRARFERQFPAGAGCVGVGMLDVPLFPAFVAYVELPLGMPADKVQHLVDGRTTSAPDIENRFVSPVSHRRDVCGDDVGDVGEIYTHMPRFEDDEEVLVFLKQDDQSEAFKVLYGEEGKIKVTRDEKSNEKVTSSKVRLNDLKSQIKSYVNDR